MLWVGGCVCVCFIEWCCKFLMLYSVGDEWMSVEMLDMENWNTQRKTSPSTILSTINPTWTGLGLNPRLCSESLVTNHLSHCMVSNWCCYITSHSVSALFYTKCFRRPYSSTHGTTRCHRFVPVKSLAQTTVRKLPLKCTVVFVSSGHVMALYPCMLLSMEWDKIVESGM